MSSNIEGVFSIRLVIADFYMEKPAAGLDPRYSEFRGTEIKKVPIVRIFGSTSNGQKTCMHVHGVFPYFYIPYEKKDFESVNKAIYQIAMNVDKAINISLGQGSSTTQHVFKVQLVKGIPFYGYHRSEHQFLKIYMYNPRFVRRAANLLQNGAILGKNFHPCEAHVPYILQFMIDYNLYGMSFLHVPLEIVKFRRADDDEPIPFADVRLGQILSTSVVKKISSSALEVDIGSSFILNRFQLVTKSKSTHANPGIEAIWHDERIRRQKLMAELAEDEEKLNAIPPLEVPSTQERPNVQPTESDLFHRTALLSKLVSLEISSLESDSQADQTLNSTLALNVTDNTLNATATREQKRTFNLRKIMGNSVYPEECTQDDKLTNASYIENHLSNNSLFQTATRNESFLKDVKEGLNATANDDSVFLENTLVDEELVLSLTQQTNAPLNASLRAEDLELLDVLQQLEEGSSNEQRVDLDSTLAPLSQQHKNFKLSPELLDKQTVAVASNRPMAASDSDSDNEGAENVQDFSIILDDIDELIFKLTPSQGTTAASPTKTSPVPQIDGANDRLRTPAKSRRGRKASSSLKLTQTPPSTPKSSKNAKGSPTRSPRTPKSSAAKKYAPLPLIMTNRSGKRNLASALDEATPTKANRASRMNVAMGELKSSKVSLGKRLALTQMRRKSLSSASDLAETVASNEKEKTPTRHSRRTFELDKTHITCALTPRRKSERLLKVYNLKDLDSDAASVKTAKHDLNTKSTRQSEDRKKATEINEQESTKVEAVKRKKRCPVDAAQEIVEISGEEETCKVQKSKRNIVENVIEVSSTRMNNKTVCKTVDKKSPKSAQKVINKKINLAEEVEEILSTEISKIKQSNEDSAGSAVLKTVGKVKAKVSPKTGLVKRKKIITKETTTEIEDISGSEESLAKRFKNKKTAAEEIEEVSEPEQNWPSSSLKESKQNASCEIEEISDSDEYNVSTSSTMNTQNATEEIADLADRVIPKSDTIVIAESPTEADESDQEIAASDTEAEHSLVKLRKTSNLKILRRSFHLARKKHRTTPTNRECHSVKNDNEKTHVDHNDDDEEFALDDDAKIHSFYETSLIELDSPLVFSEGSSPTVPHMHSNTADHISISTGSTNSDKAATIVIAPLDLPPTYEEVLAGCRKLDIFEYEFQKPFYSNPADITKQKEVGYTVLQIPGNRLNDCAEFESVLGSDLKGLAEWRRQKLFDIGGPMALNRYRNAQRVREYFASQRQVLITPQISAPSRHDAKVWLKARELLQAKGNGTAMPAEQKSLGCVEADSPIKVRRQRVTLMLNDDSAKTDADEDVDCSTRSITLTPMTPDVITKESAGSSVERSVTPLTTQASSASSSVGVKSAARQKRRSKRARLSLNARLMAAIDTERRSTDSATMDGTAMEHSLEAGGSSNDIKLSAQSTHGSNTSVSSQSVLAELGRASFVKNLQSASPALHDVSFGLSCATLDNTFGFKVDLENLQQAKADIEYNYLTTMSLEVFVPTREHLYPNPQADEIRCIFYAVENSIPADKAVDEPTQLPGKDCGYIVVSDQTDVLREGKVHGIDADIQVQVVQTEIEALEALLGLCAHWDPDIYAGYEIEMASWGYVMERAKYLCFNIGPLLSRVPSQKVREFVDEDREHFTDLDFEMKLCGRILLDVWRLMRSEIALTSYTFENVMYHILHKRGPWHSFHELTNWFAAPETRWIVIEYYLERVRGTLALLEQLDLIGRTSEMAKLIGIQFYEVLSRGSQFRVESMMLRMAKPKNLVPLSPSVQQRAHMRAPEYLPLILEPQSRFYPDPVIVLDFQSLYPSMIIAYNYCFSTCLGRVEHLGHSAAFEFGASQLRVSPSMLRKLFDRDLITISPGGVVFAKSSVREGILPRMLTEILDTRQMVKQSMKLHKTNSALQRILHSRQLGLKLMANVTYGYTAANFSGRMPAVEVGDSVVAKGRETLERAIKLVEANDKWKVQVVYGDTDSMFVLVPGRNRQQAFKIGEEIAEAVTKANPQPVKLKLEKVYQPCILQTKKRYVGYMYETAEQAEPVYEAKGIETVRRDGCPAVAKMLEKVLRILFETADVSQVKQYVCRQFTKLLSGRANLQDLIFAKEFRGLNGYKPTACVPALELTRKWLQTDPRRIPRCGERVPFVIINGPPGVPLIRLVRSPHELLADEGLKINAIYYITKAIIPPLNRCLLLIGADVHDWFANLPRRLLLTPAVSTADELVPAATVNQLKKSTISQYFSTTNCIVDCGRQTKQGICAACARNTMKTFVTLQAKIGKIERGHQLTLQICQACCGRVGALKCGSLDCPVLYVLEVKRRELKQTEHFRRLLEERF